MPNPKFLNVLLSLVMANFCFSQEKVEELSGKEVIQLLSSDSTQKNVNATKLLSRQFDQRFSEMLSKSNALLGSVSRPLSLSKASLSTEAFYFAEQDEQTQNYLFRKQMSTGWLAASVPLQVNLSLLGDPFVNGWELRHQVSFERHKYLQELDKQLKQKLDPREITRDFEQQIQELKSNARVALTVQLRQMAGNEWTLLSDKLLPLLMHEGLFMEGELNLAAMVFNPGYTQQLEQAAHLHAQWLLINNTGGKIDSSQWLRVQQQIQEAELLKKLVLKIEETKSQWQRSGLLPLLKRLETLKTKTLQELLDNPELKRKMAEKLLRLSGLQKLFLKLDHLKIGQQALHNSPFTFQHAIQNGLSTAFENKKNELLIHVGKFSPESPWSTGTPNHFDGFETRVKSMAVGRKTKENNYSRITLQHFDQSLRDEVSANPFTPSWKTLVTTLSNQLSIGNHSQLKAEISRSVSSYPTDSGSISNIQKTFSGRDLGNNMAFSLRFEDAYPAFDLEYSVRMMKVSSSYENPGSPYLNNGSTEFGGRVRKGWMKNRLQLDLQASTRIYSYDQQNSRKWVNWNGHFNLKWKFKKSQHLMLRYIPNRSVHQKEGLFENVSAYDRFSLESNVMLRLWKKKLFSFITISSDQNQYGSPNNRYENRALVFSINSQMQLGKNQWHLLANYSHNQRNNVHHYYNSTLNLEQGLSYNLGKKLFGSSAIQLNTVQSWFTQAGMRHSISGEILRNLHLALHTNIQATLKKTMPTWNGPIRLDMTINYQFKN